MIAKYFHTFSPAEPGYAFMWGLAIFFVFIWAIILERCYFVIIRSNINAPQFMAEIRKLVSAGDFKKAIALCRSAKHRAIPQVFARALEVAAEREIVDFRAVQNAVDEATLELIPKLSKRTNYLATLSNISVLFGLMGTIYGLIISFEAVGTDTSALTKGISAAMFTTFGGLINAIPAIILYSYLQSKTAAIIDDIDEFSVKLIHILTERR